MRKKKKVPEIVKVEKINELHTASITNNETIKEEKPVQKPLLLSTTKTKLNTIVEEKDDVKPKENIFNMNNIEKDIDIVDDIEINNNDNKKSKKSKKSKKCKKSKKSKKGKNNKDTIKLKNNILINNNYKYENLLDYIKCNKIEIVNILYEKKILKNKEVPLLILLNLYANYINNDIEVIV